MFEYGPKIQRFAKRASALRRPIFRAGFYGLFKACEKNMLEFMAILYHAESLPSRTTFLGEIWWKITLLLYSTTAGYSLMSPSTCISFLHVPRTKDFYETLGLISKHCYTSTLWFKASFAKEPPDAKYHPTCNFQRIRAVAHSPGYLQMAIFRAPWNIYKMILYYREKERVVSRRRSSSIF